MKLDFKPIQADDIERLAPYFCRRPNRTCDSVALDSFLWRDYYHVQFAVSDGKAVQWLMEENGVKHSAMPMCEEQYLSHYFYEMVEYFNKELHIPFKIYLADEEAVEYLKLRESADFEVIEQEDLKDYLYDGDAMRNLSGRKLHKKKNHLNGFLKEYEELNACLVRTEGRSGVSWINGGRRRERWWRAILTMRWKGSTLF